MSSPVAQIGVLSYINSFEEKENNVIIEAIHLRLHFSETQEKVCENLYFERPLLL